MTARRDTGGGRVVPEVEAPYRWVPFIVSVGLLFFLVVPIGQDLQSDASVDRLPVDIALLAFVVIYLALMRTAASRGDSRTHLAGAVALLVLAVGITAVDRQNWSVLFVAAAAVGGFLVPTRRALAAIGVAAVAGAVALHGAAALSGGAPAIERTFETIFEIALVGLGMLGYAQLGRIAVQLDRAQGEVARLAADGERARIARDLHDLLGHSLSVVALKTELARRLVDRDPARASAELREVETLVRSSLRDVREAVAGYREMNLDTELDGARMALVAAGIKVTIDRGADALEPVVDTLFAWVVREGTTNVVRHSAATACAIRVATAADGAALEISDDGRGDPGSASRSGTATGQGLAGIRERAEAVGGRAEAGPRPGGGYRLAVTLPASVRGSIETGTAQPGRASTGRGAAA